MEETKRCKNTAHGSMERMGKARRFRRRVKSNGSVGFIADCIDGHESEGCDYHECFHPGP